MLQAKYLKYGKCWLVTSGVISFQHAELYILKKISILYKKFFWAPPHNKHCTWYMLQAKYFKYGTCWIFTSWIIRDQLAELYILKNRI